MILDTNALSAFLAKDTGLLELIAETPVLFVPLIVVGEYRYGIEGSARREENFRKLDRALLHLMILLPDLETASLYGRIGHELRRKGRPIPHNDLWIAALARQHELDIVSRDTHFDPIGQIRRVEWKPAL